MTLDIPVPAVPGETSDVGESTMGVLFDSLHEQNMSQLAQIGVMSQGDLKTISKATDYDYLQAKNMVSLAEALGAREVGSRVNPGGPVPATDVAKSA